MFEIPGPGRPKFCQSPLSFYRLIDLMRQIAAQVGLSDASKGDSNLRGYVAQEGD